MREKALADKLELKALIIAGELVRKELLTSAAGGIYSIWRNVFLDIGLSHAATIAALLKISDRENDINKILQDTAYGCARELSERIKAFITAGTDAGGGRGDRRGTVRKGGAGKKPRTKRR